MKQTDYGLICKYDMIIWNFLATDLALDLPNVHEKEGKKKLGSILTIVLIHCAINLDRN